jgi:transcriptional regulator with XRE-family HTH domain
MVKKYNDFFNVIGINVKFYRQEARLTQASLSELVNKSVDTISNIERGVINAKIETLLDICKILKIDFEKLLEKREENKEDNLSNLV